MKTWVSENFLEHGYPVATLLFRAVVSRNGFDLTKTRDATFFDVGCIADSSRGNHCEIRCGVRAAMAGNRFSRDLQTLYERGPLGSLPDSDLLARMRGNDRHDAEPAFEAILARHGGLVWRVCMVTLRDPHDAEDAFQATFLILLKQAAKIRKPESLASWLHGVAYRVSATARRVHRSRRRVETCVVTASNSVFASSQSQDTAELVQLELERLPPRDRLVMLLCDLEGLSYEEAADRLGCPVGTVKSRLSRARGRLAARLRRRGLAPEEANVLAAAFVPSTLIEHTVSLCGSSIGSGTSVRTCAFVTELAKRVTRSMIMSRLRQVVGLTLTSLFILAGAVMGMQNGPAPGKVSVPPDHEKTLPTKPSPKSAEAAPVNPAKLDRVKTMLESVNQVRVAAFADYHESRGTLERYLMWNERYNDAVRELVRLHGDADVLSYYRNKVAGFVKLENRVKELEPRGEKRVIELSMIRYYRLKAEDELADAEAAAEKQKATKETNPAAVEKTR